MRALYCGNFEHDARQSDIERLFNRYGKVDRVDMKSGNFKNIEAHAGSWTPVPYPFIPKIFPEHLMQQS